MLHHLNLWNRNHKFKGFETTIFANITLILDTQFLQQVSTSPWFLHECLSWNLASGNKRWQIANTMEWGQRRIDARASCTTLIFYERRESRRIYFSDNFGWLFHSFGNLISLFGSECYQRNFTELFIRKVKWHTTYPTAKIHTTWWRKFGKTNVTKDYRLIVSSGDLALFLVNSGCVIEINSDFVSFWTIFLFWKSLEEFVAPK